MFRLSGGIGFLALLFGERLNLPLQFVAGLAFSNGAMACCINQAPTALVFF
jgi:hypothetical protein